jgi:hypothetical protein
VGAALWWGGFRRPAKIPAPGTAPAPAPPAMASGVSNASPPSAPPPPPAPAGSPNRPFPIAHAGGGCEWAAMDGKDPEVIRKLAHNDLEFQRMVEENSRILRRQLVYWRETVDMTVQRLRSAGAPVRQLVLPGLDGREIQFEVVAADLSPSGQQGTFSGRVAGRADSLVTLAFKAGRAAFTVMSPADGLYLQGDPHEPGQVIVKSIDPATYVPGVCGTP